MQNNALLNLLVECNRITINKVYAITLKYKTYFYTPEMNGFYTMY